MKPCRSQWWVIAALIPVTGALRGPIPAEAQSVVPVRFEDEAQQLAATTPGNELRIDAELFGAEAAGGEITSTEIPISTVAALCGDGDGCLLRLHYSTLDTSLVRVAGRFFATSSDGLSWSLEEADGSHRAGSLTDSSDDNIMGPLGGCGACFVVELTETEIPFSTLYHLVAAPGDPLFPCDAVCALRIED